MKSLSLDPMPRNHDSAEQELMELLSPKTAEQLDNNEDETRHDSTELYRDPLGYSPPQFGRPEFGGAMKDLHDDARGGVTERLFSGRNAADRVAQKTIAQNLEHGGAGKFTTRSLHLRAKSTDKIAHAPSLTLSERVRQMR